VRDGTDDIGGRLLGAFRRAEASEVFTGVGQAHCDTGDRAGGFLEVRGEAAGRLGAGGERLLVGCLEEPRQGRQEAVDVAHDLIGQSGCGVVGLGARHRLGHGPQLVTEPVPAVRLVGRDAVPSVELGVEVDPVSGQSEHLRRVRGLLVLAPSALIPLQAVVPGIEVPLDDESGALQQSAGEAVTAPGFDASALKTGDTDIRRGLLGQ
jgi:hypothetical protein